MMLWDYWSSGQGRGQVRAFDMLAAGVDAIYEYETC